eukprot:13082384-Alexandrium_andersonii.AAC.1
MDGKCRVLGTPGRVESCLEDVCLLVGIGPGHESPVHQWSFRWGLLDEVLWLSLDEADIEESVAKSALGA